MIQVDPIAIGEWIGGTGSGATILMFARWLVNHMKRMQRENTAAHEECKKTNEALQKKVSDIEKRSFDMAIADRTLLITTLDRNTVAVERNSTTLDRFAATLVERTPARGASILQNPNP